MTQEQRQEIITALCGYLPYSVKIYIKPSLETGEKGVETTLELIDVGYNVFNGYSVYPEDIVPYLRPMSSMTEEEKKEFLYATDGELRYSEVFDVIKPMHESEGYCASFVSYLKSIDWLNAHHFDYRGLIKKKLALEAPEGMY